MGLPKYNNYDLLTKEMDKPQIIPQKHREELSENQTGWHASRVHGPRTANLS